MEGNYLQCKVILFPTFSLLEMESTEVLYDSFMGENLEKLSVRWICYHLGKQWYSRVKAGVVSS